jgi:hypothetical protein
MRKLLLCAMLALAIPLAGCDSLPTINIQNQVNLNTTQGVVAGYGILANQLELLKQQPLCKTGTTPSIANICVPRSVIVRLQTGMTIAQKAMNSAVAFEVANPTVSPTQYISAASSALLAVQGVYNSAATATAS